MTPDLRPSALVASRFRALSRTWVVVCGFVGALGVAGPAGGATRVIIDTDPGTDDALALLLAMNSPELQIEAVTVVHGNVPGEQGWRNARRVLALGGRCDVPVIAGARTPLAQTPVTAEFWHGANGLANLELADECPADTRFAPDVIVDLVRRSPNEITLVPIGPLTNIALALAKDPAIATLVKAVVIMGGSISAGNATAVAEANIYGDPEAARRVFEAGWPLTMVGLDVTSRTLLTNGHLERLRRTHGPQNDFAVGLLTFLLDLAGQFGADGTEMHDPLALGAVIDPSFVTTRPMHVLVETRGELTRGQTVANRSNLFERYEERDGRMFMVEFAKIEPTANVALEVESDRFLDALITRLAGK
jgi:purine nucleosidase